MSAESYRNLVLKQELEQGEQKERSEAAQERPPDTPPVGPGGRARRRRVLYEGRRHVDGTATVTRAGLPLDASPSQKLWNHSPDGFNWGYGGSGPRNWPSLCSWTRRGGRSSASCSIKGSSGNSRHAGRGMVIGESAGG